MSNGATWTYYNYQNSAVPSAAPYYLDTRTVSVSPDGTKWVGCAEIASLDDPAIFYIAPDDVNIGKSWSFNDIDTFETPMEVSKIYACPYGNDVLAFLNPLGTSDLTFSGSFDTYYYWDKISSIGTTGDVVASTFVDVNTGVAVANNEIWTTSNAGVTWTQGQTASTPGDYFTDVVSYSTSVFALTAFGNYFISSDGGATWTGQQAITGYSVGTHGLTTSASFRYATNSVMVLSTEDVTPESYRIYTADGGSTWTISTVTGSATYLVTKIKYSASTQSAGILKSISSGNYIFFTSISGDFSGYTSWPITSYSLPYNDILRIGTTYIAVGDSGNITSSLNSGVTWAVRDSGTAEDLLSVDVDPTDSTKFYITGASGTILKSIDSTQNWFTDLKSGSVDENLNSLDILGGATGYTIGGSGSVYSEVSYSGLTGGFLYRYDIPNDSWKRVADGYTWPHIYDIKARGFGGDDYRYYLGTNQGIIEIPGEELGVSYLEGNIPYIPSANFYNSSNFSNLSDNVYSLGLDENFNLWSGSDSGKLQFWDFQTWQTFDTPGATASVTSLAIRDNGHVFWGNYNIGPGLYHFNGVTGSLIGLSGSNQILSLGIQNRNRNQDGVLTYENDLWILAQNQLDRLSYEIPYVKASSLQQGATGWNFTYYTQATGSTRPFANSIPGVNKYTWEYPYWQAYQTDYLQYKFPGLDPRNLFLTTELSDIASGEAGKQAYWNNPPIPSVEDMDLVDSVQEAKWAQIVSNLLAANVTDFEIYTNCIIDTGAYKRYVIGGTIKGRYEPFSNGVEVSPASSGILLGKDINGDDAYLFATNPSLAGSLNIRGGQTYNASAPASSTESYTGFIASYDEDGRVVDSMVIPGKSTKVLRIIPSEDGNSIYVGGSFNGLIEVGDYIWSSVAPTVGPTGAPIGLTNSDVPGLDTDYSWIYTPGGTGAYSPNVGIQWTYRNPSSASTSNSNFRLYGEDGVTQVSGDLSSSTAIKYISLGSSPASGSFSLSSSNLYTGMVVQIGGAYYRIDTITFNLPDSNFSSIVRCMGVTWVSGSQSLSSGSNYNFDFWYWNQLSFPLIRNGATSTSTIEAGSGIFVMELTNNIGNTTSLRDVNSETDWKYQVKNFRHFPSDVSSVNANTVEQLMMDSSLDKLALSFQTDYVTPTYKISTLKNSWNRTTDNIYVPDQLGNTGTSSDVNGVVIMNSLDFSLRAAAQINNNGTDSITAVSVASLSGTETVAVNGSTNVSIDVVGVTLTNPTVYSGHKPFYFIMDYSDPGNIGITGSFFSSFGTSTGRPFESNAGYLSKYNGYYTVTNQHYGATSGTYLGKDIELGLPSQYLVTGFINPSNSTEKVVFGPLPNIQIITQTTSGFPISTDLDIWNSRPIATETGNLVGIFTGATSASSSANLQNTYVFKQDLNTGVVSTLSLENVKTIGGNIFSSDSIGNVFFTGQNISTYGGSTGPAWLDYVTTNGNANKYSFLSEQYIPQLGVNMGQIISRPGSNPWTWCDVHQSDKGLTLPQLCTVFFSNYNSAIYGKQNNVWILSDARTGTEILNVKNTPYFIYTFTQEGYYSIYNSVEDAFGNVYEVSNPAFVTVVNYTDKNPNDKNPFAVNSSDYGWPIPPSNTDQKIQALEKTMAQDQIENVKNNKLPFVSNLVIKDNPDATFNQ
jgi:photosystem II stability/assembly factor-like uncharacterized protein